MELNDIDNLKERDDVRDLIDKGFQFPYSEYLEIVDEIKAYRFGHDVEDEHSKNHETVYVQKYKYTKKPLPPNVMHTCALSCYVSEESAEATLKNFMRFRKNIKLRMGNSLLIGILINGHGFVSTPDSNTHFNFFQKDCCNMHEIFRLHKVL